MTPSLRWDLFCRVVDNFGDIGVCWRLAADLAARRQHVRLWLDDARALAWMAPAGAPGVTVLPWAPDTAWPNPGDVVIETFGCDPPPDFVEGMAAQPRPPVWINLEYLSAEAYVERSHGLRSPQGSGPGRGLDKWFFYPGFTPATGGLLREPGLADQQHSFDREAWLTAQGVQPHAGERLVSMFCYPEAPFDTLLGSLGDQPTLLLACPGAATAWVTQAALPAHVRHQPLPWLDQACYDRLLQACDLNLVRGEDSFVRAQWAGRPFLWQIYPQHDLAHAAKLDAFLSRHLRHAEPTLAAGVTRAMRAWNRLAPPLADSEPAALPDLPAWRAHAGRWRAELAAQPDLVTQLFSFVDKKR